MYFYNKYSKPQTFYDGNFDMMLQLDIEIIILPDN